MRASVFVFSIVTGLAFQGTAEAQGARSCNQYYQTCVSQFQKPERAQGICAPKLAACQQSGTWTDGSGRTYRARAN